MRYVTYLRFLWQRWDKNGGKEDNVINDNRNFISCIVVNVILNICELWYLTLCCLFCFNLSKYSRISGIVLLKCPLAQKWISLWQRAINSRGRHTVMMWRAIVSSAFIKSNRTHSFKSRLETRWCHWHMFYRCLRTRTNASCLVSVQLFAAVFHSAIISVFSSFMSRRAFDQ